MELRWAAAPLLVFGLAAAGCTKDDGSGAAQEKEAPAPVAGKDEPGQPPSSSGAVDDARLASLRAEAKALTDTFQAQLKQRLMAAVKAGGPGSAIEACKLEAPKIAEALPGEQGKADWHIGRTALKVRNPDNAPSDWQRSQLEAFTAQIEADPSVEVGSLQWDEVAGGDPPQWRYMRAIPTGGLCLTCHGAPESLPPPVKAKLAELYPEDEATGFEEGELRGAFVVTAPL